MKFKGCMTALITPFKNGAVDYTAFAEQLEFQLANGVSGLVVLGTTGEPATLLAGEREQILSFTVKTVNKRVPVIVGTGSNSTAHTVELSKQAEALGANALLLVTPYYNKASQKGLIAHFTAVAASVNLPIIVYNVPGRTGVNMLPATVAALTLCKNIVAVKESSGNLEQICELIRLLDGKMDVFSGDDGVILPVLALGGAGVISVASNVIPKEVSALCRAFFDGDLAGARAVQLKYILFFKALFADVNPIPVKTAMKLLGRDSGELRLPLCEIEDAALSRLTKEMKTLGMI
ncbi:MAG: 4-hydroxy-tetrahydrodipicolinate synthase [Firmicutes bacterium]|nr:4-hydroxy-tetrahydrodipicolinate synthase [Bacillota bacterium]